VAAIEKPRHEPNEVFYWFAWDHSGELRNVEESEAMEKGFRNYCRILFDCSTFRYRLFVPKHAGKDLRTIFFRKLVQWLKDRYGMETRDVRGRLGNLPIDEGGEYYDPKDNRRPKGGIIMPKNPGGIS
jgi:hypothetical protein